MKSFVYIPEKGAFDTFGEVDGEDVVNLGDSLVYESDTEKFHIGQSYEDTPAKLLKCQRCGGDKFFVGSGSYFTAIKCVNCQWELCIHDG